MPPISSFLSLYGAGEYYTLSGETTLDGSTLNAVYNVAIASTLMGVVIKLRGKHIVAGGQLTLLDNTQASVGCSAGATYSEYSDVTQIIISPQGSNAIGGTGSEWKIEGSITIDNAVVDLYVGAPKPIYIICTPTPPVDLQNANVVLRKSDGSDFTSEEIAGLQITMQSHGLLQLRETDNEYVWIGNGPLTFTLEKAVAYGSEITLINEGYDQDLVSITLGQQ